MTDEVIEASDDAAEDAAEDVAESTSQVTEASDPIATLTEDLQRLQAEYSNYRKRVDRDRTLSAEIAISATLTELLPILDDLERAAAHGELTGGFKSVADQLHNTTSKLGLERFGQAPCDFDPTIHEALMHETSVEVSATMVTKVLQYGYRYKERILRPARVVVTDPEH
jgi:molecular chaperone GrpE